MGQDFLSAVRGFFSSSKLLKGVNSTCFTLVPKVPNPSSVTEFRPISCCYVVYKCITKVLPNRLKAILPEFISLNQSAFIPGRSTGDNILLGHELFKGYQRKGIHLIVPSRLI